MGIFSLCHHFQTDSGSHSDSYPMGTGTIIPGAKRPGHEGDHSSSSSIKVKNVWSYTSTPQYVFVVWCFIKQWLHIHDVVLN
jgi:hypothetical protein